MKKWYTLLEVIEFPLKMLFIAIVVMGIGDIIINPNITVYTSIPSTEVQLVSQLVKFFGSFLMSCFPMFMIIKLLSKRYEDSVPAYVGVVAYVLFNVITMFLGSTELPKYCYSAIMGLQIDASVTNISNIGIRFPLVTGLVSSIIIVVITRICYGNSRKRFTYGILSFIDNDSWALFTTLIFTAVAAVLVTFGWPMFIGSLATIFQYIADDINNPLNMFLYGICERVLSLLNLQDLIHQPFWFGELGGRWMDSFGQVYLGDVGVWTALMSQGFETVGYGKFITPYYVINLFAMPGMYLAFFILHTDKMEKRRFALFFVVATFISILFGTLLPVELLLLIMAPALYILHLIAMSSLYAIFTILSVALGYTFTGAIETAMPGNLVSLLPYIGRTEYGQAVLFILIVGAVFFIVYFAMTMLYYKVLSGDYFSVKSEAKKKDIFISAVGGLSNIRAINSSLNKVVVRLYDSTQIEYELLKEIDVYKVSETRAGTVMEFGPASTTLRGGVLKELNKYLKEQKEKPAVVQKFEVEDS